MQDYWSSQSSFMSEPISVSNLRFVHSKSLYKWPQVMIICLRHILAQRTQVSVDVLVSCLLPILEALCSERLVVVSGYLSVDWCASHTL